MNLTDKAQENRENIFNYHKSTLNEDDPEFAELYNNFLFGEIIENSQLDTRTQLIVTLTTLITNQSIKQYEIFVEAAIDNGVKPVEIKEVLYQNVPYVGMAKVYDFFEITNQVFDEKGIDLPVPGQSTTNPKTRKENGYKIQCEYFGKEMIDEMINSAPEDQKNIQDYLSAYCFGDFYTRTGLSNQDRELITFSIIASLGGCENQLRGHTAGNLAVGNTKETLIGAIEILLPYIGFPRTLNALAIVNEVCSE